MTTPPTGGGKTEEREGERRERGGRGEGGRGREREREREREKTKNLPKFKGSKKIRLLWSTHLSPTCFTLCLHTSFLMADFIQAASSNSPLLFLTDVLTQLKLFNLRERERERERESLYT